MSTAASQSQTPPRCRFGRPRLLRALTIVVDPGWLQELHCSAAAGLKPEPCPSARLGHGAAAASSRAARPPAAAHPCPQRRRAIAGPRPQPPPQPPPALGRRRRRQQPHPLRRSSSGGSGATPEVTARTCQIAPAGNRSRRGRGRLGSSVDRGWGRGGQGYSADNDVVAGEGRCEQAGKALRSRPEMQSQGGIQISSSTSAAPSTA